MRQCNLDNMRTWIAALESGDFEQAQGSLRIWISSVIDPDRLEPHQYCCLGVATELAVRAGVTWDFSGTDMSGRTCPDDRRDGDHEHTLWCKVPFTGVDLLMEEVSSWLGLLGSESLPDDPILEVKGLPHWGEVELVDTASNMNDAGATFQDIADRLRILYLPQGEWPTSYVA